MDLNQAYERACQTQRPIPVKSLQDHRTHGAISTRRDYVAEALQKAGFVNVHYAGRVPGFDAILKRPCARDLWTASDKQGQQYIADHDAEYGVYAWKIA